MNACLDFLALGLDPDKAFFWVQGDVPEVCELTWILNNHTPVGLLERAHSYKDKIAKGFQPHNGLFSYPVLMAADILLYQADAVPVGKDQKQHLEITRDIAIKFNNAYGETFTVPEPWIEEDHRGHPRHRRPEDVQELRQHPGKSSRRRRLSQEKGDEDRHRLHPGGRPQGTRPSATSSPWSACSWTPRKRRPWPSAYRAGGMGYGEVKKELFARMWEYFAPYRAKREELAGNLGLRSGGHGQGSGQDPRRSRGDPGPGAQQGGAKLLA